MPPSDIKKNSAEQNEIVVDNFLEPLKVGDSIQLSLLSDHATPNNRHFVKYLGGLEKTSLICTLPMVDDKILLVKENSAYSVSLFTGKNVYRFTTLIDVVLSRPYPHMHLKFPREIFTNKLRKNHRISTNLIASIRNKTSSEYQGKLLPGRIVDLSMGGIMLETRNQIGKFGDAVECSFKVNIEGQTVTFTVPGLLCKVTEPSDSEPSNAKVTDKDTDVSYQYGIKFSGVHIQHKIMLRSYIFQSLTGEKIDEL